MRRHFSNSENVDKKHVMIEDSITVERIEDPLEVDEEVQDDEDPEGGWKGWIVVLGKHYKEIGFLLKMLWIFNSTLSGFLVNI